MSTTYSGTALNFPSAITLPSDGDPLVGASVNPAFEGLMDRTARIFRDSLNGYVGGTWDPSGAINVGGSGFTLNGTHHVLSAGAKLTCNATSIIDFRGNFASTNVATYTGVFTFSGGATIALAAGTSIISDVSGTVLSGKYKLTNAATFRIEVGGTIDVGGDLTLQSGANVTSWTGAVWNGVFEYPSTATLEMKGTFRMKNPGSEEWRVAMGPTSSPSTIYANAQGEYVRTVMTGDTTYNLSDVGIAKGNRIVFSVLGSPAGHTLSIVLPSTATITLRNDTGFKTWVEFICMDGAAWSVFRYGAY